jgi:hypothetical protein
MCHGTHQYDGLKQICNNVLIGHFLTTQFQSLLLAITPGNARGSLHHMMPSRTKEKNKTAEMAHKQKQNINNNSVTTAIET